MMHLAPEYRFCLVAPVARKPKTSNMIAKQPITKATMTNTICIVSSLQTQKFTNGVKITVLIMTIAYQ